MELEFDKEIDAILRKARRARDVSTAGAGHLDADAIAAFAENSLPENAKNLYIEHFADCGRCRQLLAQTVAWPPAENPPKAAVVSSATASVPWYSRLFRTPNLAMAMGALLLVFGGIFAVLVINRNSADRNSTISQVTSPESKRVETGAPAAAEPVAENSNSSAAANSVAANIAGNVQSNTAARADTETAAKTGGRGPAEIPAAMGSASTDGVASTAPPADQPIVGSAPPRPVTMAPPPASERKDDDEKVDKARDVKEEDRMAREAAPVSSRKAVAGPNRAAGPRQNAQTNSLEMNQNVTGSALSAPVKTAGGKRFEKRDGAWYDTAYHGQATKDIARNSPGYKDLDAGLRSVANAIGGVVVIVWKGTAYRIQ